MKKQYIAPSLLAVNILSTNIIAVSGEIDSDPTAHFSGAGAGDAGDAGVKESTNTWDDEW